MTEKEIGEDGHDVLLTRRRSPSKAAQRRASSGEPGRGKLGLGLGLSTPRGGPPRVKQPARAGRREAVPPWRQWKPVGGSTVT